MANAPTMHPLQFPDVASWRNNPRLGTGRGTQQTQPRAVLTGNQTGIPLPVTKPTVTKATAAGQTQINLSHLVNPNDPTHSHVDVWASGYLGNRQPVKISSGTSPHSFLMSPTGESVTLHVQSVGKDGSFLPLNQAPTVSVKL